MSKQYKTFLVLVFGIFVGVSVSLTSSVLAEKKMETSSGLPLNELRNFSDIFPVLKLIMSKMWTIKPYWKTPFAACCPVLTLTLLT